MYASIPSSILCHHEHVVGQSNLLMAVAPGRIDTIATVLKNRPQVQQQPCGVLSMMGMMTPLSQLAVEEYPNLNLAAFGAENVTPTDERILPCSLLSTACIKIPLM